MSALITLFWICTTLVFYSYVGYALLVWILARYVGTESEAPANESGHLPTVSLLIAAYNEQAVIEQRIQNALQLDYPADKLEIVVASDGSSDATASIVRRFAHRGVRLLDCPQRRGKATVLDSVIPTLAGQIVVLSDANTLTDPPAIRNLVRWFRRPEIGAVCGHLVLNDPHTGQNADGLYWKYETFLKKCEGRLGALLGANGAIYAIRKDLYVPIPRDTIVDDLVIPLLARLKTGCAIVYDDKAIAREETAPDVAGEFRRRARIGAGGFQSIGLLWPLLNPLRGWIAFTFLSHKILRWLCPFFLLAMLAASASLLGHPFYRAALFTQVIAYAASALAILVPALGSALRPLRLTTLFAAMNLALLVGFCRWLLNRQAAAWNRTAR